MKSTEIGLYNKIIHINIKLLDDIILLNYNKEELYEQ